MRQPVDLADILASVSISESPRTRNADSASKLNQDARECRGWLIVRGATKARTADFPDFFPVAAAVLVAGVVNPVFEQSELWVGGPHAISLGLAAVLGQLSCIFDNNAVYIYVYLYICIFINICIYTFTCIYNK